MATHTPTIAELRGLIAYEAETGRLTWRVRAIDTFSSKSAADSWNTRYAGRPALATENGKGHLKGSIYDRQYFAHRVAWAIHYGFWPSQIDHINGDRADNRICNLREATTRQNSRNRKAGGESKFLGVSRSANGKRWRAYIHLAGRTVALGTFDREEDAARAYDAAARKHFGEFARPNFEEGKE